MSSRQHVLLCAVIVFCSGLVAVCFGCSTGSSGGGKFPDAEVPCEPFESLLDEPYVTGFDGIDIRQWVTCGTLPYSCGFYGGDGEGTVPAGVTKDPDDPTGCTLIGDVDPSAPPGSFGFIVRVLDALGAYLEIPVFWPGRPCATEHVTMDATENPPRVETAGTAYQWMLTVDDLDYPCDDGTCGTCNTCMNMRFLELKPLSGASPLACANQGDVCSDCGPDCIAVPPLCPYTGTMHRVLQVRAHDPIRALPSWVTLEFELNYTGDDLAACGNKHWLCHMEVLER